MPPTYGTFMHGHLVYQEQEGDRGSVHDGVLLPPRCVLGRLLDETASLRQGLISGSCPVGSAAGVSRQHAQHGEAVGHHAGEISTPYLCGQEDEDRYSEPISWTGD